METSTPREARDSQFGHMDLKDGEVENGREHHRSAMCIEVEPQPGPSSGSGNITNPFHVDTSLIPSVPTTEQESELQELGLTVFNQDDLEQGVMAQVDQAMAAEEQERARKVMGSQLKTVKDDMRTVNQELHQIEKVLKMVEASSGLNKEAKKKIISVRQQRENKLKQIKKLKAKSKSLQAKLSGRMDSEPEEDADGEDEGSFNLGEALGLSGSAMETETERMIRLGEMTPFGTIVARQEPVTKVVKVDPHAAVSDFDKYLLDQGSKAINKRKPGRLKRSHTDTGAADGGTSGGAGAVDMMAERGGGQHGSGAIGNNQQRRKESPLASTSAQDACKAIPKKKSRESVIEIDLTKRDDDDDDEGDDGDDDRDDTFDAIADKGVSSISLKNNQLNIFDAKDKRNYRPGETDFSKWNIRQRPHMPRPSHNFSGDPRMCDYDVGDEDRDEDLYGSQDWDADYRPEVDVEEVSDEEGDSPGKKFLSRKKGRGGKGRSGNGDERSRAKTRKRKDGPVSSFRDDGNAHHYEQRLRLHHLEKLKRIQEKVASGEPNSESDSDIEFDGDFKVPGRIWNKLYRYQKTGVRWLWELHGQQAGGIIGDEMGLGKTIQMITFLLGMRYSRLRDTGANTKYIGLGPTLIVTPATVMHQWVKEFHTWAPEFRVGVMHSSGSHSSSVGELIRAMVRDCGILITSFAGIVIHQDLLLKYDWHYVVLDEGHKIRNPDAQVTLASKQFRTCHRIILSGSPVQNNLKELWSLFDFIFPGKLGTLPDFMAHFSVPIVQGGYANATEVQVQTAYKCACVLRDTINPYLLRRMKSDVQDNLHLPSKNEQVLFCRLTDHQKDVYKEYLESNECQLILSGNFMVFPGLTTLRKVCNHPDISTGGPRVFNFDNPDPEDPSLEYGFWKRSGKLIVVESLLRLWKKQGHRVLLFSQSKQMLDILETFVQQKSYSYMRMDGTTTIASRQPLISNFNNDPSVFIFLLTTRVGGVGVNLTGANRVVIYDPDWNPSTDTQARERAWRIGQQRQVTIYRLLTIGTIEEKIYHRQIFKQFLTNRVLKDPKQRRFFKSNDMYELFSLGDDHASQSTETSAIFAGTNADVKVNTKVRGQGQGRHRAERHRAERHQAEEGKKRNRYDELRRREKEAGRAVVESDEDVNIKEDNVEGDVTQEATASGDVIQQVMASGDLIQDDTASDDVTQEGTASGDIKQEAADAGDVAQEGTDFGDVIQKAADSGDVIEKAADSGDVTKKGADSGDVTQEGAGSGDVTQETVDSGDVSTTGIGVCDVTQSGDARIRRMKEMARMLSKKISGTLNGSEGTAQAGGSNTGVSGETGGVGSKASAARNGKRDKDKIRRREERRRRKKRKDKDIVFEGERIAHLSRHGTYHQDDDHQDDVARDNEQDDYVLGRLLRKKGVHSAMQHDTIMMSSNPDFALVESEADRVAQEAVRALKQSRSQCHRATSGIPTWTGQSGTSAAPKARFGQKKNPKLQPLTGKDAPREAVVTSGKKPPEKSSTLHFDGSIAGNMKTSTSSASTPNTMTSQELLTRMRTRNHYISCSRPAAADGGAPDEENGIAPAAQRAVDIDPEDLDLITDIRNHVAFGCSVDGRATTQELLDHFRDRLPASDAATFKAMLNMICSFRKQDGIGIWQLRPELR